MGKMCTFKFASFNEDSPYPVTHLACLVSYLSLCTSQLYTPLQLRVTSQGHGHVLLLASGVRGIVWGGGEDW